MGEDVVEKQKLICAHCDCEVEYCAFCDEEDCPKATCYTCVIVAIGQETSQLHDHGG
jgi:hypothetical protein